MTHVDDLAAILTQRGWRLIRGKNHHFYRCPCGQHAVTLSTTGCRGTRTWMNERAIVNRQLRACQGDT